MSRLRKHFSDRPRSDWARVAGCLGEGRRTVIDRSDVSARPRWAQPDVNRQFEEFFVPEVKLTAELRTEFGKGAARRIRRANKVPPFCTATAPTRSTSRCLVTRPCWRCGPPTPCCRSTSRARPSWRCLSRFSAIRQAHHRARRPGHVRRGEKVTSTSFHVEGEAAAGDSGRCRPQHHDDRGRGHPHPDEIVVSVEGRPPVRRSWPATSSCRRVRRSAIDPDTLIVNITAAQTPRRPRPSWPPPRPTPASSRR